MINFSTSDEAIIQEKKEIYSLTADEEDADKDEEEKKER